jgi:CRP-like cAMP-binding protein
VLEGAVDLAATIVDAPAVRLAAGQVLRSRGTIDDVVPVRLVGATDRARVATWDEKAVESAFRTCPWVEDDLRAAADRPQALAGITMGPLGERLDPAMRDEVTAKLRLRALATHEAVAHRGQPVPGLLAVGAGELELLGVDGAPTGRVLRPGDFVFPSEVLSAAPAPHGVRAGRGGALLLVADRGSAQELLVSCPPLLELFAGM